MKKRTLIIAEMLCENITNGVSRYSEMLYSGLPIDLYKISYIKFVFSHKIILPKRIIHKEYMELIVPLPINSEEIIENSYWLSEFNRLVERIISPYLENDFIFHIQTMNLISLAVFLRQEYNCKIVSHIHCIPWKYKYSSNQLLFNQIYYRLNIAGNVNESYLTHFVTSNEINIIRESDAIICVTKSSKDYYERYLHAEPEKIFCIYNGIRDELCNSTLKERFSIHTENDNPTHLLYVGNVTENKGFQFVLEALRKVSDIGYNYVLLVAGSVDDKIKEQIEQEYKNLNIKLLGHVDYSRLQELYKSADIGLISSLFEQCSYVALEMMMHGLPVVYSGIEELREVFGYNDNMNVPVKFTIYSGLGLDVDLFADKIMKLMDSQDLRREVGLIERKRFNESFTQDQMIQETIDVYNKLYQYEEE